MLNALSLGELANQDHAYAVAVAEMIDRVMPRIYFQEAMQSVVDEAEKEFKPGDFSNGLPDADKVLLPLVAGLTPPFGGPFSMTVAYRSVPVANRLVQLGAKVRDSSVRVLAEIERQHREHGNSKEALQYFNPRPKRVQPIFATRALYRALVRRYFADPNRKQDPNEGLDFMHALVPSAYCTFVVLDCGWSNLVKEATSLIRNALIKAPIARPFGSREAELNAFLDALEAFQPVVHQTSNGRLMGAG